MATLKQIETKFKNQYPYGSISKVSTNKYMICFDARDSRSEAQKELDIWGVSADKRKFYTYYAKSLKELSLKLKIEDTEEYQLSKVNQEWEAMLKVEEDYSFELFGE